MHLEWGRATIVADVWNIFCYHQKWSISSYSPPNFQCHLRCTRRHKQPSYGIRYVLEVGLRPSLGNIAILMSQSAILCLIPNSTGIGKKYRSAGPVLLQHQKAHGSRLTRSQLSLMVPASTDPMKWEPISSAHSKMDCSTPLTSMDCTFVSMRMVSPILPRGRIANFPSQMMRRWVGQASCHAYHLDKGFRMQSQRCLQRSSLKRLMKSYTSWLAASLVQGYRSLRVESVLPLVISQNPLPAWLSLSPSTLPTKVDISPAHHLCIVWRDLVIGGCSPWSATQPGMCQMCYVSPPIKCFHFQ